jgi:cytochrome c-type biogenesis protein CcmH/NrfG
LIGDNGQPERYQVAYELLGQVLEGDNRNTVALFNRAVVSERLREYQSAVEDWTRLLEVEPKGGWADEARRREELKKNTQPSAGTNPSTPQTTSGK